MMPISSARLPRLHWKSNVENQRKLFNSISQQLNIKTHEDWYKYRVCDVQHFHGVISVLHLHKNSLIETLKAVYPEYPWKVWKFTKVPNNYWRDMNNHRLFFDDLGKEFHINTLDDWYNVDIRAVKQAAGPLLALYYGKSLWKALQKIYPEKEWYPWKFASVQNASQQYWKDTKVAAAYLDWLSDQFGIQTLDDWLSVPASNIPKFNSIKKHYGGLQPLLARVYPDHNWNTNQPALEDGLGKASKSQIRLFQVVKSIFPSFQTHLNYLHPKLTFQNSLMKMQFDVFVEELNLAFEYEGEQHYHWNYLRGSPDSQMELDAEKQLACKESGITLIQVPYWWDRSRSSVLASIHKVRPDLVTDAGPGKPFPSNPRVNSKKLPHRVKPNHPSVLQDTQCKNYPYFVSQGKPFGLPRCRGCRTSIPSERLRINVRGTFTPMAKNETYTVKYAVCMQSGCLEQAVTKYSKVHFPPFHGKIGVPSQLLETMQNELNGASLTFNQQPVMIEVVPEVLKAPD